MSEKLKKAKSPSAKQKQMALSLNELSGNSFRCLPKRNSGYLSLDVQLGKSTNNKNAVSVSRNYVSFMVPDWAYEDKAKSLGLRTERREDRKSLRFPEVTVDLVTSHAAFFKELLEIAEKEARSRQGASR